MFRSCKSHPVSQPSWAILYLQPSEEPRNQKQVPFQVCLFTGTHWAVFGSSSSSQQQYRHIQDSFALVGTLKAVWQSGTELITELVIVFFAVGAVLCTAVVNLGTDTTLYI